jgi:hypothetical protein
MAGNLARVNPATPDKVISTAGTHAKTKSPSAELGLKIHEDLN